MIAHAIGTLGGVGRLPAPGTFGSALVLPAVLLGPLPCLVLAILLGIAGFWAARAIVRPEEDPGWFVADEGAGMLLALAALPSAGWPGVLIAFALFRLFDIAKPWPVSWADAQPGALGVMLDDVVAGGIVVVILLALRAMGAL